MTFYKSAYKQIWRSDIWAHDDVIGTWNPWNGTVFSIFCEATEIVIKAVTSLEMGLLDSSAVPSSWEDMIFCTSGALRETAFVTHKI